MRRTFASGLAADIDLSRVSVLIALLRLATGSFLTEVSRGVDLDLDLGLVSLVGFLRTVALLDTVLMVELLVFYFVCFNFGLFPCPDQKHKRMEEVLDATIPVLALGVVSAAVGVGLTWSCTHLQPPVTLTEKPSESRPIDRQVSLITTKPMDPNQHAVLPFNDMLNPGGSVSVLSTDVDYIYGNAYQQRSTAWNVDLKRAVARDAETRALSTYGEGRMLRSILVDSSTWLWTVQCTGDGKSIVVEKNDWKNPRANYAHHTLVTATGSCAVARNVPLVLYVDDFHVTKSAEFSHLTGSVTIGNGPPQIDFRFPADVCVHGELVVCGGWHGDGVLVLQQRVDGVWRNLVDVSEMPLGMRSSMEETTVHVMATDSVATCLVSHAPSNIHILVEVYGDGTSWTTESARLISSSWLCPRLVALPGNDSVLLLGMDSSGFLRIHGICREITPPDDPTEVPGVRLPGTFGTELNDACYYDRQDGFVGFVVSNGSRGGGVHPQCLACVHHGDGNWRATEVASMHTIDEHISDEWRTSLATAGSSGGVLVCECREDGTGMCAIDFTPKPILLGVRRGVGVLKEK